MDERPELGAALAAEMARWRAAGLERELADLPVRGADFTSNDVLGLASHPEVIAGARAALEEFGAGGRASRLLGGGSPADTRAEDAVARWLEAEAALLFPSGYHANLGVITALAGPGDVVVSDELNHASLIDGARLSRARVLVYRHADLADAERAMLQARGARRVVLATESVFSMDGDLAPLEALAKLCARHGAWLVVDEAHACGLLGPEGAGAMAALGRSVASTSARIVTGSKALGAAGAFVVGSRALREHLVNRARTFAFTTAAPPAVAGALTAAIDVCRREQGRRERALALARRVASELELPAPAAAIVSVVCGAPEVALDLAAKLQARELHVRAVRPPTVPAGSSRLRIVCHSFNTEEEVACLLDELRPALRKQRAASRQPLPRTASALFVAGTDTDVGKTVVSALLVRAAARRGRARYWKPVQTGPDSDTREVARLAEIGASGRIEPEYAFAKPASPHEAAEAEVGTIDPRALEARLQREREALGEGTLVVELAGGLFVPLTREVTQLDWLARARPALVLVARSGVGTLNHTLLSLEALRARQLEPRALFLVGPPHASNRETLRALGGIERVFEVPMLAPLDGPALERWLGTHDELLRIVGP